jgi:hypothetical protein
LDEINFPFAHINWLRLKEVTLRRKQCNPHQILYAAKAWDDALFLDLDLHDVRQPRAATGC